MAWPETVRRSDLKIEFMRGSGAGGQNRNKRDTACRMTHIPTGITTQAQEHRTQEQNRSAAWKRLCDQLVPLMKRAAAAPKMDLNKEIIRSYREPDRLVVDKRLSGSFDYYNVLEKNGLDDIIEQLVRTR